MKILQINASARSEGAQSTRLANEISERLRRNHPDASFEVRDLASNPLPILDAPSLQALFTDPAARNAEQSARVAVDDAVIEQVKSADVIVLGVPMYNFGIPVQLKAWLDAITRAKVTFQYTENGPEGLLKGKKVYLALARGGRYRNTPNDSQVPYLTTILGFLGMTDLHFIYAEGLAMGEEAAAQAFTEAREQLALAM